MTHSQRTSKPNLISESKTLFTYPNRNHSTDIKFNSNNQPLKLVAFVKTSPIRNTNHTIYRNLRYFNEFSSVQKKTASKAVRI